MAFDTGSEFANYLRGKNCLAGDANVETHARDERTFRRLWEQSELSASDFADTVGEFFKLPRVQLAGSFGRPGVSKTILAAFSS